MKPLTNILSRVFDLWAFRDEPEYARKLADIYWGSLLVFSACLIVGALTYGGIKVFDAFGAAEGAGLLSGGGGGAALSRDELRTTLDAFSQREANYELIRRESPKIADPAR